MVRRTRLTLIGAGLVMLVSATACGADPDTVGVGSTSAATALPSTATPSTAAPSTTLAPTTVAPTTVAPTTAPATTTADTAAPATSRTLYDFVEAGSVSDWANVNDTVMGGVSSSTTTWDTDRMVFSGDLSLENNGGFTSTRGPIDTGLGLLIGSATALTVDATGDGKTYLLQVRTLADELYVQRFTTTAGEQRTYVLPLAGFEPVGRFLDPLPEAAPLDPATVVQMVIYLLDKQDGPFRLEIVRIAATEEG